VLHCFNTTLWTAEQFNALLEVTENDVMLSFLPVGLNWGYLNLVQTVMAGCRIVLVERFTPKAVLELIERERVTYVPTPPAAIVSAVNDASSAAEFEQRFRQDTGRTTVATDEPPADLLRTLRQQQ